MSVVVFILHKFEQLVALSYLVWHGNAYASPFHCHVNSTVVSMNLFR